MNTQNFCWLCCTLLALFQEIQFVFGDAKLAPSTLGPRFQRYSDVFRHPKHWLCVAERSKEISCLSAAYSSCSFHIRSEHYGFHWTSRCGRCSVNPCVVCIFICVTVCAYVYVWVCAWVCVFVSSHSSCSISISRLGLQCLSLSIVSFCVVIQWLFWSIR